MKFFIIAAVLAVANGLGTLDRICAPQFKSKLDCIQNELNTRVGDVSSYEIESMYECIQTEMNDCADSADSGNAGGIGSLLSAFQGGAAVEAEVDRLPDLKELMEIADDAKECIADELPMLKTKMEKCMSDRLSVELDIKIFRNNSRDSQKQLRVLRTARLAVNLADKLDCPKILTCAPNKKTFKNLVNTVCTRTNTCDRRVRTASCKTFATKMKDRACDCASDIANDLRRDSNVDVNQIMTECVEDKLPYDVGTTYRDCALRTVDEDKFKKHVCESDMTDPIDIICEDNEGEHIFEEISQCLGDTTVAGGAELSAFSSLLGGGASGSSNTGLGGLGGLSSLTNGGGLGGLSSLTSGGGLGGLSSLTGGGGLSSITSLFNGKKK